MKVAISRAGFAAQDGIFGTGDFGTRLVYTQHIHTLLVAKAFGISGLYQGHHHRDLLYTGAQVTLKYASGTTSTCWTCQRLDNSAMLFRPFMFTAFAQSSQLYPDTTERLK